MMRETATRRRLTLSFDNGPFPGVTDAVLDALGERGLHATFFVCGKDLSEPVVLHDVPTGAMARLPAFLDRLTEEAVAIVQEFPADCVPIRRGKIVGPLERIVAPPFSQMR